MAISGDMDSDLMSPRQRDLFNEFKATFEEEEELLQRRKKLIQGWQQLRTEETLQKIRERNLWRSKESDS